MQDLGNVRRLYLDLMKKTLTDFVHIGLDDGSIFHTVQNPDMEERISSRTEGRDWPSRAETMIGLKRLDNLQFCMEEVIQKNIPGDIIETGIWRGGACIFARAILEAFGDKDRKIWCADSFEGLPPPRPELYPEDKTDDPHHSYEELKVSLDRVKQNFARYGMLDDQVRFLPGWFHETLPAAPIERLAVARLDGDMYESTIVALEALYDRISTGGFLIVDDYNAVPGCQQAVDDFRQDRGITAEMITVDWAAVYWRIPD